MKNPIIAQAAMDIEAARKIWLPWRILLPWGLFCLIVMLVCDQLGKLDISMPLLVSIGMFAFFIYLKWSLRREPLFWTTIAILASLHLALIWYIPDSKVDSLLGDCGRRVTRSLPDVLGVGGSRSPAGGRGRGRKLINR